MKPEFRTAIEERYNLKIQNCEPGPRQFVAETYVLEDEESNQYFCKLVDKPLFIEEIIRALPLVAAMHAQGIERICYPIENANGLYLFVKDTLIVLYNHIPALQSEDYSAYALGQLTAQIHALTPHKTPESSREDFTFPYRELFDQRFDGTLASRRVDPVTKAFQAVLRRHEAEIRGHVAEFQRLAKVCWGEAREFVITHGDAPGNVLVKSLEDIYIIDWDEALLAPAERDLWMIDHIPEFMEGYKSTRPDFAINATLRSFYILKYYLQRNMHYFSEILKEEAEEEYRLSQVHKLEEELLRGWMLPRLQEVKENRRGGKQVVPVDIRIRASRQDDLPAMQDIRHKAFQPVFDSFREIVGEEIFKHAYSDWDEKQAEYLKFICDPASGKEVFVVTEGDGIVGFIGLSMDLAKKTGEIDLNAVHPDYNGKGIGQEMYEFAITRMKESGIKLVTVSTGGDSSHIPARKAYKKAGFNVSIPSTTMFKLL